jgi:hypothetical protein
VIESGWDPGIGGMTGTAICPVISVVIIIIFMTGIAITGCACIYVVGMATATGNRCMRAGQFKGGKVVVESGRSPCAGGVTGTAVRPKPAVVVIIFFVTGIAVTRCSLENSIDMTVSTGNRGMRSCQFKAGKIMVEGGRFPGVGCVTGTTVRPQAAGMPVVSFVAGITVGWRAFVDIVDMATGTDQRGMSPGQFEGGQVMVEGGRFPSVDIVTDCAVGSKSATVFIYVLVAGITIVGSTFIDIIDMTIGTSHRGMCSTQLER